MEMADLMALTEIKSSLRWTSKTLWTFRTSLWCKSLQMRATNLWTPCSTAKMCLLHRQWTPWHKTRSSEIFERKKVTARITLLPIQKSQGLVLCPLVLTETQLSPPLPKNRKIRLSEDSPKLRSRPLQSEGRAVLDKQILIQTPKSTNDSLLSQWARKIVKAQRTRILKLQILRVQLVMIAI